MRPDWPSRAVIFLLDSQAAMRRGRRVFRPADPEAGADLERAMPRSRRNGCADGRDLILEVAFYYEEPLSRHAIELNFAVSQL